MTEKTAARLGRRLAESATLRKATACTKGIETRGLRPSGSGSSCCPHHPVPLPLHYDEFGRLLCPSRHGEQHGLYQAGIVSSEGLGSWLVEVSWLIHAHGDGQFEVPELGERDFRDDDGLTWVRLHEGRTVVGGTFTGRDQDRQGGAQPQDAGDPPTASRVRSPLRPRRALGSHMSTGSLHEIRFPVRASGRRPVWCERPGAGAGVWRNVDHAARRPSVRMCAPMHAEPEGRARSAPSGQSFTREIDHVFETTYRIHQ